MSRFLEIASAWEEHEILVLVKAYPRPSNRWEEAVCVAGVTRGRQWVRLYPVPFRQLPTHQRFQKWQFLKLKVRKSSVDPRGESLEIDAPSIRLESRIGTSKTGWKRRRYILEDLVDPSVQFLRDHDVSLGMIRPSQVTDFWWREDDEEWPEDYQSVIEQTSLLAAPEGQVQPVEKIPWKFGYNFICSPENCTTCSAGRGHSMQTVDWEIYQLYRNCRGRHGVDEALAKVKEQCFERLTSGRTMYFMLGTALKTHHFKGFMIIGYANPPFGTGQERLVPLTDIWTTRRGKKRLSHRERTCRWQLDASRSKHIRQILLS